MFARGLIAAAVTLLGSILCAPAMAQDTYCDLAEPPANAVATADHGYYLFIFPDVLPDRFTGCKTWWIESGQKFLVFRLKDGRVTEMVGQNSEAAQAAGASQFTTCLYPNEVLANKAADDCLDFGSAQSFAELVIGGQGSMDVPAARDIRSKAPL